MGTGAGSEGPRGHPGAGRFPLPALFFSCFCHCQNWTAPGEMLNMEGSNFWPRNGEPSVSQPFFNISCTFCKEAAGFHQPKVMPRCSPHPLLVGAAGPPDPWGQQFLSSLAGSSHCQGHTPLLCSASLPGKGQTSPRAAPGSSWVSLSHTHVGPALSGASLGKRHSDVGPIPGTGVLDLQALAKGPGKGTQEGMAKQSISRTSHPPNVNVRRHCEEEL